MADNQLPPGNPFRYEPLPYPAFSFFRPVPLLLSLFPHTLLKGQALFFFFQQSRTIEDFLFPLTKNLRVGSLSPSHFLISLSPLDLGFPHVPPLSGGTMPLVFKRSRLQRLSGFPFSPLCMGDVRSGGLPLRGSCIFPCSRNSNFKKTCHFITNYSPQFSSRWGVFFFGRFRHLYNFLPCLWVIIWSSRSSLTMLFHFQISCRHIAHHPLCRLSISSRKTPFFSPPLLIGSPSSSF